LQSPAIRGKRRRRESERNSIITSAISEAEARGHGEEAKRKKKVRKEGSYGDGGS
jgi:hypothetical protein